MCFFRFTSTRRSREPRPSISEPSLTSTPRCSNALKARVESSAGSRISVRKKLAREFGTARKPSRRSTPSRHVLAHLHHRFHRAVNVRVVFDGCNAAGDLHLAHVPGRLDRWRASSTAAMALSEAPCGFSADASFAMSSAGTPWLATMYSLGRPGTQTSPDTKASELGRITGDSISRI